MNYANWNTSQINHNGIRPPNPSTTGNLKNEVNVIWSIPSFRRPYATEYLVTKYGGLETKLGTNLGK